MEEFESIEEKVLFKTKYILFQNIEDWQRVVDAINTVRGYPNELNDTENYISEPLISAEIKDENDVVIEASKYVLPIMADLQENYSYLFAGMELVDDYQILTLNT